MTSPGVEFGSLLLFDGLLALLTSFIVIKKDFNSPINRLVSGSLFLFGIYFIPEGLIYVLPLDFDYLFNPLLYITLCAAVAASTTIAFAGLYTWHGGDFVRRPLVIASLLTIMVFAFVGVVIDSEMVYDPVNDLLAIDGGAIYLISLFGTTFVFLGLAFYGFFSTLKSVPPTDPLYNKILFFCLAIGLIIIGLTYYSVLEAVARREGFFGIIGHLFYTGASVIMIYAFKGSAEVVSDI